MGGWVEILLQATLHKVPLPYPAVLESLGTLVLQILKKKKLINNKGLRVVKNKR